MTVMCCCRARWGRGRRGRRPASSAIRCGTRRGRGCGSRGGGRARGRGRRRSGRRPGVPVAGSVRQRAERAAQALVARPAEAGRFAFAGLDRDRGLAGVGGERVAGWVTRGAVTDLRQHLRGADHAAGSLNSERKISPSGCSLMAVAIWRWSCLICATIGLIVATRPAPAAGGWLSSSSPTRPVGPAELCQQLRGLLAAGVVLAGRNAVQALLPRPRASRGLG